MFEDRPWVFFSLLDRLSEYDIAMLSINVYSITIVRTIKNVSKEDS